MGKAHPNLVGWWRMDGDANDASGNGNHGALGGGGASPLPAAGKFGMGYAFDGIDDYIATPIVAYPSQFTLAFWINFARTAPAYRILLDDAGMGTGGILLQSSPGLNLEIILNNTGNSVYVVFDAPHAVPTAGVWIHYAIVVDAVAGTVTFYKDGVRGDGIQGATLGDWRTLFPLTSVNPLTLGGAPGDPVPVNGTLNEVMRFHAALSSDDVRRVMLGKMPIH